MALIITLLLLFGILLDIAIKGFKNNFSNRQFQKEGNMCKEITKEYIVPNIVHYIWFSSKEHDEMKFHHMLSILSAYKFIKPDTIYYHYDVLPRGKWWDYVSRNVPILVTIKTEIPLDVFGVHLIQNAHKSDIKRFDIMRTTGGIYLDNDVLVFKSFNPLRRYNFTMGQEVRGSIGNSVIIGARNTTFLNLWWDTYKNFTNKEWAHHSCIIPARLWKMYPHLIHVEIKTILYPDWTSKGLYLLYDALYDWSKNYCVHMWYRQRPVEYDPENIKTLNTTFGEMARYIFYGNKKLYKNE